MYDKIPPRIQKAFAEADWDATPKVVLDSPISVLDLVMHPDVLAFSSAAQATKRIRMGAVWIDGVPATRPSAVVSRPCRVAAGQITYFRLFFEGPHT